MAVEIKSIANKKYNDVNKRSEYLFYVLDNKFLFNFYKIKVLLKLLTKQYNYKFNK